MTVSSVASEIMILLQPKLVQWWNDSATTEVSSVVDCPSPVKIIIGMRC